MKNRSAQICLTVVCLVFGVLLMAQFRTQGKIAKSAQLESSADQAQIISNLYDANLGLRKEVNQLETQLREQADGTSGGQILELVADLEKFRIVNGTTSAAGPGVELMIRADIRSEDIQDLINEFRNAGSEALALNGERITYRTAVMSDRGVIMLDGRRLADPYVFDAIGAPETLERALTRKGGLVSYLQTTYPDGLITVERRDRLVLPPSGPAAAFQQAEPYRQSG